MCPHQSWVQKENGERAQQHTIFVNSLRDIEISRKLQQMVCNELNVKGFVIIQIAMPEIESLHIDLKHLLGDEISHERAVYGKGQIIIDPLDPNSVNVANTCEQHMLHTDESYKANASQYMTLFCQSPSPCGGGNIILVDGHKMLAQIKPSDVKLLQKPLITVGRTLPDSSEDYELTLSLLATELRDNLGHECQTFERLRWRSRDSYLRKVSGEVERVYNEMNSTSLSRTNQVHLALKKNQLLIVDNARMVHGRTGYRCNHDQLHLRRILWRTNLSGNSSGILFKGLIPGIKKSEQHRARL